MTKQISQIIYEVELERPLDDGWYEACQEIKHRLTEAMGWRKYPDEIPDKDGFYIVLLRGIPTHCTREWDFNRWRSSHNLITHWLPIPELPGVKKDYSEASNDPHGINSDIM
jgi:hypothetical protein